jgi:hypothetical protein
MANPQLPPPPLKVKFVDENGVITQEWQRWLRELLQRIQEIDLEVFP